MASVAATQPRVSRIDPDALAEVDPSGSGLTDDDVVEDVDAHQIADVTANIYPGTPAVVCWRR